MKLLESFVTDVKLSVYSESKLEMHGCKRISSRLTPVFKYLMPVLSIIIAANGTMSIEKITNVQEIVPFAIYGIVLYLIFSKLAILKNVFLSSNDTVLIVMHPYSGKTMTYKSGDIRGIRCTQLFRPEVITLRLSNQGKDAKTYFLGTARLVKAWTEHPMARYLSEIFIAYKPDN